MKTFRLLGREIKWHFSIKSVKRIAVSIPEWANDAHLRQGNTDTDWSTPDGKTKVCYYKGSKVYFIDIPECKRAEEVYVTPMYKKDKSGYNPNRVVIVDLYN